MISRTIVYPDFSLCLMEASSAEEVPNAVANSGGSYSRIEIPSNRNNIAAMLKKGYLFVDRTIGVAISLRNINTDIQKLIRFETRLAEDNKEEILHIAHESFPYDSRFHIRSVIDDMIAKEIINEWVENLSETYVCLHKDQIVGFLDLEPYGEKDSFIHLAAVKERYRAAGAAVSLYAKAILIAKEKDCEKLHGRISSENYAVMNLYARLGGSFSDPKDVFVRNEQWI